MAYLNICRIFVEKNKIIVDMTEIYWITRLASIRVLAIIILVLAIIALVVVFVFYLEMQFDDYVEEVESVKKFARKWRATWICSVLFGIVGVVFIPSERDMLLIYGLGSTIDYIKSNDKAKQLPDKAVDALTRYLDSIQSEKNKE